MAVGLGLMTWKCCRVAPRPFPMPRGSGLGFSYRDRRRLDRSLFMGQSLWIGGELVSVRSGSEASCKGDAEHILNLAFPPASLSTNVNVRIGAFALQLLEVRPVVLDALRFERFLHLRKRRLVGSATGCSFIYIFPSA